MSNLEGFRTRPAARPGPGYVNGPAEDELATYKQLDLIDRLRKERKLDPLPRSVSSIMTKPQAGTEIDNLFATPKYVGPPPGVNDCPPDWDQQVWDLALLFVQYARADGIMLAKGLPVIYTEVSDLVTRWNMREKSGKGNYAQEVHGCARRELGDDVAARCWYHWPPKDPARQARRVLTWVEMTEVIMAELWSRVMDEYALDHFRQHFAEYGMECTRHWKSLQIIREINERPKDAPRPVMRRRKPSGTMTAGSKEG